MSESNAGNIVAIVAVLAIIVLVIGVLYFLFVKSDSLSKSTEIEVKPPEVSAPASTES